MNAEPNINAARPRPDFDTGWFTKAALVEVEVALVPVAVPVVGLDPVAVAVALLAALQKTSL